MPKKSWPLRREFMLMMLYPFCDDTRVLASMLNVSYHGLKSKAGVLKIKRLVPNIGRSSATLREDNFIRRHYLTMPVKRIAEKLGREGVFVNGRLSKLGLVIPREIIEQRIRDARIQPGSIPPNKGKKIREYMSKDAVKRVLSTTFKKGHLPKNAEGFKDGDITIRHDHIERGGPPYKYVRLSLGKWYPLHQHKWEKKNGKLPESHCLWFIDGNPLNCTLKNLELITRAENMKRNSASRRLTDGYVAATMSREKGGVGRYNKSMQQRLLKHPELIDLKRQSMILNRSINEQRKLND